MTAYPAWTPASRPGIIPLYPLSFGTILGRSFTALRQNPRVLLGFALVVQTLGYFLVLGGTLAVAWLSFSRLDTLVPGTEEYGTVTAGSIGLTLVTGVVLTLAMGVLSVIVQGIVVVEVAHAAVAEKLPLGQLWRQVKPVVWRLLGYSALVILAMSVVTVVGALPTIAAMMASPLAGIPVLLLTIAAAIPLYWWLTIKLLLVPAAIIIEHATIRQALGRSWTLTRGRFWPSLGVIFLIGVIFGAVAQVISFPLSFLSGWLSTIIAPTGAAGPTEFIGLIAVSLLAQALTLLVQSVALVVQSTATAIIYIDCRMRREGLDLDLLAYVDRRDAGATTLADPYREHIGREIAPRGLPAQYPAPYPPGFATAPGYAPQGGYPVQGGYPAPNAYPGQYPAPAYPLQTGSPAPSYPAPSHPAPSYPAPPSPAHASPATPGPAHPAPAAPYSAPPQHPVAPSQPDYAPPAYQPRATPPAPAPAPAAEAAPVAEPPAADGAER